MTSTKNVTFQLSQLLIFSYFVLFPISSFSYDMVSSFADGLSDSVTQAYIMNSYNINKQNGNGATNNNQPNNDNNLIDPDKEKKLIYQYNSDTHNLSRQRTINYFDKLSGGSTLADFLRKTDVVEIYRKDIPKLGFNKNSVTDADAYLWLQAWQAIHYTDETTITPEVIEAVRLQFKLIGINRKLYELRDGFQQIYAEARISQAMIILSLQRLALKSNEQSALAIMIQAARGSVPGIDGYKLTQKGFEVKKETLSPEGAQLGDVYFNQLSSVTILKTVGKKRKVSTTAVVVKTANGNWYQRHENGNFSVWDLQLSSLNNNHFITNTEGAVEFDIIQSMDLSSVPDLFPMTVYIGNIYNDGQLNWGYFDVKSL